MPSLKPDRDKNFGGSLVFFILDSDDVTWKRSIRRVPCGTEAFCNITAYEEVHHMLSRFTDFRTRFILSAWTRAMLEKLNFTFKLLVWYLVGGSFSSVALSKTSFLLALGVGVSRSLQYFNPSLMGPMLFCCFVFPKRPFVQREVVGGTAVGTRGVTSLLIPGRFFFTSLDAMFVDISLRFIARDFRVEFLKLAPSRDIVTSSRAVKKLQRATLRLLFAVGLRQKAFSFGLIFYSLNKSIYK